MRVASPSHFNVYRKDILKQVEKLAARNIIERIINNLTYAVDIVLLIETWQELQGLVDLVNRNSAR